MQSMWILVVVIVVGVVAWLLLRAGQGSTASSAAHPQQPLGLFNPGDVDGQQAADRATSRRTPSRAPRQSDSYTPPRPSGAIVEAWSPRTRSFEVAGESYYDATVRRLFRKHRESARATSSDGHELTLSAALVTAPTNPFDSNAVAVYVDGHHVGYLAAEDAPPYHRALSLAEADGLQITFASRQWAVERDGRMRARVTLRLPEPDGLLPPVDYLPTGDHFLLPAGGPIQVTKEDEHMDVLTKHVLPGGTRSIAASLHLIEEQRARSVAEVVEVRIRGQRVGVLSAAQTKNLRALVESASAGGRTAVSRAEVSGTAERAEVVLFIERQGGG